MTDAPSIRSEASAAQEIESLRSTVAALDDEIARLKATPPSPPERAEIEALVDAFGASEGLLRLPGCHSAENLRSRDAARTALLAAFDALARRVEALRDRGRVLVEANTRHFNAARGAARQRDAALARATEAEGRAVAAEACILARDHSISVLRSRAEAAESRALAAERETAQVRSDGEAHHQHIVARYRESLTAAESALETMRARVGVLESALRYVIDLAEWMSGSGDFGPGGLAEVGWKGGRNRLGLARAALASPSTAAAPDATPAPGKCVTCDRGPGVAVSPDNRCRYCLIAGVPAPDATPEDAP